ncbi:hypothetical protein [Wenzhouxiangella sp. XN24]|uniref:hypothetical protein n=1 Tax=Wenzhouxiangella sp. XN24 TaxID=2713569 RepID=UPI0013EB327C|nr:hypothetical protein [Wenzhouxiangella sp. XN24]NGX16096.1 hypothetical protein [Wenzhouxiangella sp. XN24]
MINEPAEEQAARGHRGRTLDAWSWIARAREAAARAVEPTPPAADGPEAARDHPSTERDSPAA